MNRLLISTDTARAKKIYYQQDPCPCIVNTEFNSGNFSVNREKESIHDTWAKLQQYLKHDFIRSLFNKFIGN
jgi:hypothetical protein